MDRDRDRGLMIAAARAARSGSRWPAPTSGPHPQTGSSARSSGSPRAAIAVEQVGVAGEVRPPGAAHNVTDRVGGRPERPPAPIVDRRRRDHLDATDRDQLARSQLVDVLEPGALQPRCCGPGCQQRTRALELAQCREIRVIGMQVGERDAVDPPSRGRVDGGRDPDQRPDPPRRTGSVSTRTPSISSSAVACPSQVTVADDSRCGCGGRPISRSERRRQVPSSPERDEARRPPAAILRPVDGSNSATVRRGGQLEPRVAAVPAARLRGPLGGGGGCGVRGRSDRPPCDRPDGFRDAFVAAALIALLNAALPPLVAALRLPFTLALGFVAALILDPLILLLASQIDPNSIKVDSFGWALLAALVIAAATVVLEVILGANDDDTYTLGDQAGRAAGRASGRRPTCPGSSSWRSTDWRCRFSSGRCATATCLRCIAGVSSGTHRLDRMGDRPELADRREPSRHPARLQREHPGVPVGREGDRQGHGLLVASGLRRDRAPPRDRQRACLIDGGASRGNLFSGEADAVILTVSRMSAEKRANPGYRAFFANGFNVTRVLVLFVWEVILERSRRRGRGGGTSALAASATRKYALLRAGLCVGVRDLIVFGVLTDMMRGRPAVYATFSSYDEVAHHSGLERADTLEALRKLDQHFARIDRARRFAPRPYKLVVLSDHGQTQGATFKQRNGYDLTNSSSDRSRRGRSRGSAAGTRTMPRSATRSPRRRAATHDGGGRGRIGDSARRRARIRATSGSIYLMEERRRLTLEEIEERHPRLLPALREHPHIGFLLVRSREHGAVVLGRPRRPLPRRRSRRGRGSAGAVPRQRRRAPAPDRRVRARRGHHGQQLLRPRARAGLRVRGADLLPRRARRSADPPFILLPSSCRVPIEPIVGAAQVHGVLIGVARAAPGRTLNRPSPGERRRRRLTGSAIKPP